MRRVRILSFDAWLCLALAFFVSLGTGAIAGKVAEKVYERELAAHASVVGEIGEIGRAHV